MNHESIPDPFARAMREIPEPLARAIPHKVRKADPRRAARLAGRARKRAWLDSANA